MTRRAKLITTTLLLFLVLLGGCTSTKQVKPLGGEQLHRELATTLVDAAYGMDTTTLMAKTVEELLPANALPMNRIAGIPLFEEQLSRFKDEVNTAFLSTAWEIAPLLEPIIQTIPWSDDLALVASSVCQEPPPSESRDDSYRSSPRFSAMPSRRQAMDNPHRLVSSSGKRQTLEH